MKADFRDRCFDREAAIPSTSIGAVEPAAMGMGMAESRINDAVVGNAKDKLAEPDARQAVILGQQAIVRRVIEIEDVFQVRVVISDAREHAVIVVAVFRRDQSMRVELTDEGNRRGDRQCPPRRESTNRRTVHIAASPP